MGLQDLLSKYKDVKTGQDLIDAKVIPKNMPSHVALIIFERMKAIRDIKKSEITLEMMGEWKPAFDYETYDGRDITPEQVFGFAKKGMKVKGVGKVGPDSIEGLAGTIRGFSEDQTKIAVEFETQLINGVTGQDWCDPGKGLVIKPQNMKFSTEGGQKLRLYKLAEWVTADEKLGYKIRFADDYKGPLGDGDTYKINANQPIPKGTIAMLTGIDEAKGHVKFRLEHKLAGFGDRVDFVMKIDQAINAIEASTLGQELPKNLEMEIERETIMSLPPKTRLDYDRAKRLSTALLMAGKDHMCFWSAPGAGKSQLSEDLADIFSQMGIRFVVPGCQMADNPFSLFDEKFFEKVPPCEECKEKYDPNYKKTKIFNRPAAKDVQVQIEGFNVGHGMEFVEGTMELRGHDIRGYKIPNLNNTDPSVRNYDPQLYTAGVLPRNNNGVVFMEDLDKASSAVIDNMLMGLSKKKVKPDMMKDLVPANSLMIANANDPTKFSASFNDRVFLISLRYSNDEEVLFDIYRSTYIGEGGNAIDVDIGDTHILPPIKTNEVPIPSVLVRAMLALYKNFRVNYKDGNGDGKTEIMGSQRSINDASDACNANYLRDSLFFEDMPAMPNAGYVMEGIQFAMESRVQVLDKAQSDKMKGEIKAWIVENYPKFLKATEDKWWCNVTQDMGHRRENIIRGTRVNYLAEMEVYKTQPERILTVYNSVRDALKKPSDAKLAKARVIYPFMDFLFTEQPGFDRFKPEQVAELLAYHADAYSRQPKVE